MKIHENKEKAEAARFEFQLKLEALAEELGIHIEETEFGGAVFFRANYKDTKGNNQTLF